MGTNLGVDDETLSHFVMDKFPLTPRWISTKFGLDKPCAGNFLYADVAARGQGGVESYPWEKCDFVDEFKALIRNFGLCSVKIG